jgi:hypothetical protein
VVPRLGTKRRHHFAHYEETGCQGALETALHIAAKSVFMKHDSIKVPDVIVEWKGHTHTMSKAQYVHYSSARTEARFGGTRPDVALSRPSKATPLLVEVYVTHRVDEAKKAKLAAMGYPCIEVDVSTALTIESFDEDELERILIDSEDPRHKRWLCIPNEEQYVRQIQERVRREQAEEQQRKAAAQAAEQRRLTASIRDQRRRQQRIDDARRSRGNAHPYPSKPHTDIHVPHETAFVCPRHVWQDVVFRQWVQREYLRNGRSPGATVDVAQVEISLHEYHAGMVRPDSAFAVWYDPHAVAHAVAEYLDALEALGFVRGLIKPDGLQYHNVYEVLRME